MIEEIHIHIHIHKAPEDLLERLTTMEAIMSDIPGAMSGLTTAITALTARIDEDVAHLQALLAEALATKVTDQATITRLTDEAATVVASINEATTSLSSIDPVADFPTPPVEPTA